MATPDFSKIWGVNSPLSEYTFLDADYLTGWNFIGAVPPDRRMFDSYQRLADTKLKWLYDNSIFDDDAAELLFLRQPSTAYTVGTKRRVKAGPIDVYIQCTSAGTTSSSDLTQIPSGVSVGGTFADGTVTWQVMMYAPTVSPALTGNPTAPTQANSDDSTKIATTAYVKNNLSSYAPKASPALTGTPTAPTAASGTNTTQLATTAFVQTALSSIDLSSYAPKNSPALTGTPTAPTAAASTNNTQIATTAFVKTAISGIDLSAYAPKASPALTGTPTAPTAATATNTTQIATTAFVHSNLASYAPLASPALTGTPTSTTPATSDDSTKIATTAFVKAAIAAGGFELVSASLQTNGYIKAKVGATATPVLFQWGKQTIVGESGNLGKTFSFPTAFTSAVWAVTCSASPTDVDHKNECDFHVFPASLTQYTIFIDQSGGDVYWMAIGQ